MKRLTLFFICYISVYNVFAQEQKTIVDSTFIDGVPFKSVNEFYIFGDVAVIGNNIHVITNGTVNVNQATIIKALNGIEEICLSLKLSIA